MKKADSGHDLYGCMQCGMCTAVCPGSRVSDFNPRTAINLTRHGDPHPEKNGGEADPFDCFQCYSCTVCPKQLSPGETMKYLREVYTQSGRDRRFGLLRENLLKYGQSIVPEIFDNADKIWGDSWKALKESKRYKEDKPKKREISQEVIREVDYLVKSAKNLRLGPPKRRISGDLREDFDDLILFESCCGTSHYPGIGRSSRYILEKMGFHLKTLDEQSCCGGFAYYANDLDLNEAVLVGARNQGLIENIGETIVSECTTCFSSNMRVGELLTNPDNRRQVNDILSCINRKIDGDLNITHIEEVLHDNIHLLKDRLELDLTGLNVATHSGCHYRNFSPKPYRNRVLEEVVKATGANLIDYPLRNRCCGGGFEKSFVGEIEKVRKLNFEKQSSIRDAGADLLITDCPGCLMTFDRNNPELSKTHPLKLEYMHISQFIALAMGADPHETVGIQHHSVPVTLLPKNIGTTAGLQASLFRAIEGARTRLRSWVARQAQT